MKDLIYYPSFEPKDLNWIKYALIHIDSFSPIIPDSGKSALTELYTQLDGETDILKPVKPKYDQGNRAATKALKEIEFIEKHPEQYRDKLNHINVIRNWKDETNWNYQLYEEKFNYTFKNSCINKGFAKASDHGMKLSKSLAELYMTFMVEEVAHDNIASPITDNVKLDNFSTYLRTKDIKNDAYINAAKTTVEIILPQDINDIELDRIIEFRNEKGIKELRSAFNNSLDGFYRSLENDFDPSKYISDLEGMNKEFTKEILLFFGGLGGVILGGVIMLNEQNSEAIEVAKSIAEGSIYTIGGGFSISKSWELGDERRKARKFLNKLEGL